MPSKITAVPFNGTKEQQEKLQAMLAQVRDTRGALMAALQQAQGIYGYLPIEVQTMVADGLGIRLEEVYGVATFYSQFSLTPKGKYSISVCLGTACYVKGAGDILAKVSRVFGVETGGGTNDGKFSLEACRCIGACGLAPVLTINEEVYGRLTVDDIDEIYKKYSE